MQRERIFLDYKQRMYHLPDSKRAAMKKVENSRRKAKRRSSMSNND